MRCQDPSELGVLLREAREEHGLSQRRLALRAGTSQDAISRIERGVEAPTLERFAQLMLVLGRRPVVHIEPIESSGSEAEIAVADQMTDEERLREAISWNRFASQVAIAGEEARAAGHPATHRSAR
jgi:transcriptional regulator with XRE-family HTH domain